METIQAPGSPERISASFVIPCYNLGRYLPEAVESVLAQTRTDYELLIVDDGSTDAHTRDTLEALARRGFQVLRQPNRGLAAARNAGIGRARGAFICCLDADDRLCPAYLERTAAVLESRPEVGFVSSFYREFGEHESLVEQADCTFPRLLVENRAMVSSLFRKEAWAQAGGFCESFSVPGYEDWDLWISLVEAGWECAVVPEVLFEYRVRSGSMYRAGLQDPTKLGETLQALAARHRRSYERYAPEVVGGLNAYTADLLRRLSALEIDVTWWRRQAENWQAEAEARGRAIAELKEWIETLQTEKDRLAAETARLQAELDARGRLLPRPQALLRRLRGG